MKAKSSRIIVVNIEMSDEEATDILEFIAASINNESAISNDIPVKISGSLVNKACQFKEVLYRCLNSSK